MNLHPDYPPKKFGDIIKIRSYALIFALLSIFFTAIAYGSNDAKKILTPDERLWLTQNQSRLILAVETGYAPFVFLDSKGQPAGFAHDYLRLIESKLDVRFKQKRFSSLNDIFEKVRNGEVHIVNAVTSTPERSRFLAMTSPFVSVPNVIIVGKDRSGRMREKDLSGLKVSLVKSYAVTEHLTNKTPGFTPNLVPDDLTALLNVSFGQSDAAVIDLATASYLISQKGITNLRVAGEVAFDIRLSIGSPVGEPVLHSILQKGLDAITDEERQEIHKRWINTSSQSIFTDRRFWVAAGGMLFVVLVIIAVILIWNRTLRQQIALRTEALAKERKYIAERKQLEQQLSRRLHHRDVMERITRISFESATVEELLGKVLDEVLVIFNADRAWFLYPCDPDAPSWSVPMERTRPEWPGAFARGMAIPMTQEVAEVFREVLASTEPLPYGPAASRDIPATVARQFSIRSQIQMALRPRAGSPWAMGLHHCAQAHAYGEDDLLLFRDIGRRVADALSSMTILKNLRESEESLNRAQAISQIGSWLLDIPTNRLEWSAETYRMFGMPQQQAIDLGTFVAAIHPDDRDFVLKTWSEALAGAPYDIEHRIMIGGQERWVRERARVERDAEGWPLTGIGTVQDITERKRAETELRASEQKFMRLFMEIPIPLGVAGKEGVIARFNNKFTEVFGYTVDDVPTLDEWWLKAYPDETYRRWVLDNWNDAVAKATNEGTNVESAEYRVTCKDGAERIVIIGGSPVEGGVLAIFNDITERKRSEETLLSMTKMLRASQQLLDSIIEHIPVMVFVKRASDLRFELFNRAGEELLGYSRSDLLGKGDYDFWPKEQGDWFTAADRKVLASEGVTEIPEEPIRTASGDTRYLHTWKVALRDEDGKPAHLLGISIDITERKQAEDLLRINQARFSTIFNQAPSGIALIDSLTGKFYEVNPRYAEIAGRTIEEITAIDWMSITHPDDLQEDLDNMALLNAGKIPGFRMDKRYIRPDGSIVWINMTIAPLRMEKDTSPRHLAMIDDITERKNFEEELKRSNTELEQFSYAVSHDMRQPLRMISSYLQLLEKSLAGQLDNEKRDYFNFAVEGAKRIDQMLVALLEYSRIGRMGEPPAWIDSRAVLDEALQFLQPAIAEAQAKVSITGEWPRVLVSHDEILRLLQNLIGNAIKYRIAARTPEISVTSEASKNEWRLCVADNGVGIIPDQIKRLFQVFQRLQSREAYEGTGIGLALCRKIAEHHKGRIWAESAGEGRGSRFHVVLPVSRMKTTLQ